MKHIPVLEKEVLDNFQYLGSIPEGFFVDATLGYAGHTLAILRNIPGTFKVIGIDRDQEALDLAKARLFEQGLLDRVTLVHDNFRNIKTILDDLGISVIAGALIDLGVSSMQLDSETRGFSFAHPDAPLDMRMDQSQKISAQDIINAYSQTKLEEIFRDLGEERYARNIAKNIGHYRKEKTIKTVGDLLKIVEQSIPAKERFSRPKHFATNVFRGLRIAVNEELVKLDKAVSDFIDPLQSGARLGVISFHSTEDRIVKNVFRNKAQTCKCPPKAPVCVCGYHPEIELVTKKPLSPSTTEIEGNPRARSAKLRVVGKL
ncbi:MAG: Ribosomal RNA small subunit methyltransferase H [bacterium ADurb.Bin400]|nr:MAG: Ribosomal RNA small subunit methyltransferase H [bacterium ADurb.Bin400]